MSNFFTIRRKKLGLTQRQIAAAFTPEITDSTVSSWEREESVPRFSAEEIARVYQVKVMDAMVAINNAKKAVRSVAANA